MANNITFKVGNESSLPSSKTTGQLLFALNDSSGSIYYDKDGSNRIKFNADALKLANARTIQTNLSSTSSESFDGTKNITPGITGTLAVSNGGTGATSASDARTNLEVPSKTGEGASGIWEISVSGNAATAGLLSLHSNITTNSTRSTGIGSWNGTLSDFSHVYSQQWKDTSISDDTGNLVLALRSSQYSPGGTELCVAIDGDFYAMGNKVLNGGNYTDYTVTKTGDGANGTWGISINGNAATATQLATARTLTIGNTAKTFDGSGDVSWSLSEIGAAELNHTHSYLPLSGGTLTGLLTVKIASDSKIEFGDSSYDRLGALAYFAPSGDATSRFYVKQFSRSSTDYSFLSAWENFLLPSASTDRTTSVNYEILTTKSAVTIAQGGTGATTKINAKTNLGIKYGTSLPSTGEEGDIFFVIK